MTPTIRSGSQRDRERVLEIALRLAAFGPPPWRTRTEITEAEVRTLREFFDGGAPPTSVLVVAELAGAVAGFAFLEQLQDYFTRELHGHIGMIAVAESVEGQGVGAALMRAAESWAAACGYTRLTLSVFQDNVRARGVYEHFGFRPDTIRYLKPIGEGQR